MTDQVDSEKKDNKRFRKEKPWDTDDIDKWNIPEFTSEHSSGPFLEKSTFSTLFPKYRESYLSSIFPSLCSELEKYFIRAELDLIEGSMTVSTTRKTYDPYIILKARDVIKLLSRSVPLQQATRVLQDNMACEVVKIGSMVRNKERFLKRRQRLIGTNGNTLKALELLTGCYVLVQGNTVSIIGEYKGLKQVRKIVVDTMKNNVHPVYCVKELLIKRELMKDPALKNASWDRFLPHYKNHVKSSAEEKKPQDQQKQKRTTEIQKKEYTPFPPPQTPRKVDLLLESGEYFLTQEEKINRAIEKKKEKQSEVKKRKMDEKEKLYIAPEETGRNKKETESSSDDPQDIVRKLKSHKKHS